MLTTEKIELICEKISKKTGTCTVRAVREALGEGSLSTIAPVVKAWNERQGKPLEAVLCREKCPKEQEIENLKREIVELKSLVKKLMNDALKTEPKTTIDENELLKLISVVEQEHRTKNYTPLYLVREKLPNIPRKELDALLWRLAESRRIRLSALQEAWAYSKEQIDAGIPQRTGGPLFFVVIENSLF